MIFLIILLGAFLRLYNLGLDTIWIDEAGRYIFASTPIYELINVVVGMGLSPPLPDYINNVIGHTFGYGEFQLRFIYALSGIASIFVAYKLAGLFFESKEYPLLIAGFISVSQLFIAYSRDFGGAYSLWALTIWISLYYYIKLKSEYSEFDNICYMAALIVSGWLHYYTLFFVVIILIDSFSFKNFKFFLSHAFFAVAFIPALFVMLYEMKASSVALNEIYSSPLINIPVIVSSWIYPEWALPLDMRIPILVLFSILILIGMYKNKHAKLLFSISIGMVLLGYYISSLTHQFSNRYFLPFSIGAYILAAYGIQRLKWKPTIILILLLISNIYIYSTGVSANFKEDWKTPINELKADWHSDNLIVFPNGDYQMMFEYYQVNESYFGFPENFNRSRGYNWGEIVLTKERVQELEERLKSTNHVVLVQRFNNETNINELSSIIEKEFTYDGFYGGQIKLIKYKKVLSH